MREGKYFGAEDHGFAAKAYGIDGFGAVVDDHTVVEVRGDPLSRVVFC